MSDTNTKTVEAITARVVGGDDRTYVELDDNGRFAVILGDVDNVHTVTVATFNAQAAANTCARNVHAVLATWDAELVREALR